MLAAMLHRQGKKFERKWGLEPLLAAEEAIGVPVVSGPLGSVGIGTGGVAHSYGMGQIRMCEADGVTPFQLAFDRELNIGLSAQKLGLVNTAIDGRQISELDRLILFSVAQNTVGGIEEMVDEYFGVNGDWSTLFADNPYWNTQSGIMLDAIRELYEAGWELPEGITLDDLDRWDSLLH